MTTAVIPVPLIPDYPRTHPNGFSYCVSIDPQRATRQQVLEDCLSVCCPVQIYFAFCADIVQMQYCKRKKGPIKHTTTDYLACGAMRFRYECTGLKRCEYIEDEIRSLSHTEVTDETWARIKQARKDVYQRLQDPRKKKSTRYISEHLPNLFRT
jgi:hypothetical protein